MTGRQRLLLFSPLLLYLVYLWHLSGQEGKPFLVKWLEGCFGLFVALVFCNFLRQSLPPGPGGAGSGDGDGEGESR